MKFIAKQEKSTGKWAIYQRQGTRKTGHVDTFVRFVEHGMHTACVLADAMTREQRYREQAGKVQP